MSLLKNVKGQGMSTNTIILLILGVVILVVMILGFTMGWQNIAPWISPTNVDDIVTSCNAACATNSRYDFCSSIRTLRDGEGNRIESSCLVFSTVPEFSKYGVASCERIDCGLPCDQIRIGESRGVLVPSETIGLYQLGETASEIPSDQTCVIQDGGR